MMNIRAAELADVPEVQAIYAHHVLHGVGTFEEEAPPVEEMERRYRAVVGRGWAYLVAADARGAVAGYAYFGQMRDRSAYRLTAETSIYVRHDARGLGVGKALLARLLDLATAAGFRQAVAVIGDSANAASIALHASLGFQHVGLLRSVGLKFGRWVDVVMMQRALGRGDLDVPE
ncbi:hypothetical protein HK100_002769 [Physocladia obscura]|uniref:N-acetyltransferase domain-containing protein n=1 Tax=Physocladia obscura TaxID=109957 RepID=A0AAD5XA05_9FUNG|nr:hypothetical protein HK100_002769 [Physocladia obscura]